MSSARSLPRCTLVLLRDADEVAHEKAHVPEGLQVDVVVGVGAVGDVEGPVPLLPEGDLWGHDRTVGDEGRRFGAGHCALHHPLWNVNANHAGDLGSPGPRGADHLVGLDASVFRDDGLDGPVLHLKPLDGVAGAKGDAVLPGGVGDGLGSPTGLGLAVVGREYPTEEGATEAGNLVFYGLPGEDGGVEAEIMGLTSPGLELREFIVGVGKLEGAALDPFNIGAYFVG